MNIFYNRHITIGNRPIYPNDIGLNESQLKLKVNDLLNRNGNIMTFVEIQNSNYLNVNTPYINSLLYSIPREWKKKIQSMASKYEERPHFNLKLNMKSVSIFKVTSSKIYWEIINRIIKKPTALDTWLDLFPFLEDENWSLIYRLVYKITAEPYLQSF